MALRNQNNRSENGGLSLVEAPEFSENESGEAETDIVLEQVKAPVIDINAELKAEPAVLSLEPLTIPDPVVTAPVAEKKSFTVIEIKPEAANSYWIQTKDDAKPRARRVVRKKTEKALAV